MELHVFHRHHSNIIIIVNLNIILTSRALSVFDLFSPG